MDTLWVLSHSRGPCESSTRILNWQTVQPFFHLVFVSLALFLFYQCSLPLAKLMGMLAAITFNVGVNSGGLSLIGLTCSGTAVTLAFAMLSCSMCFLHVASNGS